MKHSLITEVFTNHTIGEILTVKGWVRTRRDSKGGFSFIELNDGSSNQSLQLVVDNTLSNYDADVLQLQPGASISATGQLVSSAGTKQTKELKVTKLCVYGHVDINEYPLQKKRISFEKLREIAHLRPRTNTFSAMTRVRNQLAVSTHNFFQEKHFYYLNTPIITANDCEGAGEMFNISTLNPENPPRRKDGKIDWSRDFFARQANLTVSGQLAAETHACALGRVYTFGPTFRAENSNTSRHLAEFWMVEPEIAFADLEDDADLAEAYLKYMIKDVLENCLDDLKFFNQFIDKGLIDRLKHVVDTPFERMTYTQAIQNLQKAKETFEFPVDQWGIDLQAEHERYLTEKLVKKPVILTDYPKEIKAFYMKLNEDNKTVRAMDVLCPGIGEIIGGSQREDRYDVLVEKIIQMDMDPSDYWWYLDLRKFGSVPHSGFGLGFERMVQFTTGLANIRDVIPFPRTPKHAEF